MEHAGPQQGRSHKKEIFNTQTDAMEALIKTKTQGECIVTISNGKVQVVVSKGTLNEDTALQILNTVTETTEIDPADVSISENK